MDNQQKAEYLSVPYHILYGWVKEYCRKLRAGESDPIKGNLTEEEKELLSIPLAILTKEERELIEDIFYREKSMRSIGEKEKVTHQAIGKRRDRILEKLRKILEDEF